MANQRRYSFEEEDDTSYYPPSQQQQQSSYRPQPQGYTVSNPASYLPDMSRARSGSPNSSNGSPPSARYPHNDAGPYREQQQYERGGYGIPMQEATQPRMSAYRRQREKHAHRPAESTSRSRYPPASGQVSLDGQSHNIPLPPAHSHARSMSPARQQPVPGHYTDRSPSRERVPLAAGAYDSSPPRQDPFGDPFSTPRSSQANLPIAAAGSAGYGAYKSTTRPGADRVHSTHNAYADSPVANFRNRDDYRDIDPADIDDDDDPFSTIQANQDKRRTRGPAGAGAAAGAGTAAGAGAFLQNLNPASRDASGQYGAVPGGDNGKGKGEQSTWLSQQTTGNKRLKWIVFGLIALVIILAIVGGIIGVVVSRSQNDSSSSDSASGSNSADSGAALDKNSPAIKKLMNDPSLHKVFHGMDYTPLNSIWPECVKDPPSQNHVTQDVAVLSQLSPIIRLYSNDCNTTELVLHALDALDLKDSIKIWAGIYLGTDDKVNDRQIAKWWSLLDEYGSDPFLGVIVGNEVVFNDYMSQSQLISIIGDIRAKIPAGLKVATSGLGSQWTAPLAKAVDVVMSNVHPIFGGVAAPGAAAWTYNYWMEEDVALTGSKEDQVIAEVGWASDGENYCTTPNGAKTPCASDTAGSVAGIPEFNTFMESWVCPALKNGTQYFWFEAFDEPWKKQFDTTDMKFETHWGLMDVDRKLKEGLTIPDCGGQEATLSR